MKRCKSLNLVEELGYVTDSMLVSLYKGAQGLIYLSKYEGFGLPPLEAMSLGCPVITTKFTSIPEVCGNAAIYVEPENIEETAASMKNLWCNEILKNKLKPECIKQANNFSWEKTAKKFIEIIDTI